VAGELVSTTEALFDALDAMDVDRMMSGMTADVQGVDEISRRWLRGSDELGSYLRGLVQAVSGVRTEIRDPDERTSGDVGILTCWLEQDYTIGGESQHISAPTTIVFRREDGVWKLSVFHSIPLPEQE
jgi:ketosteroid isomerase-like protein